MSATNQQTDTNKWAQLESAIQEMREQCDDAGSNYADLGFCMAKYLQEKRHAEMAEARARQAEAERDAAADLTARLVVAVKAVTELMGAPYVGSPSLNADEFIAGLTDAIRGVLSRLIRPGDKLFRPRLDEHGQQVVRPPTKGEWFQSSATCSILKAGADWVSEPRPIYDLIEVPDDQHTASDCPECPEGGCDGAQRLCESSDESDEDAIGRAFAKVRAETHKHIPLPIYAEADQLRAEVTDLQRAARRLLDERDQLLSAVARLSEQLEASRKDHEAMEAVRSQKVSFFDVWNNYESILKLSDPADAILELAQREGRTGE